MQTIKYFSKKLVYSEKYIERAPDTGVLTNKDIAYIQEFINERTSAGGIGTARASRGIIFPTLMVKVVWSCILTVISKEINFRPPKMPTEEITLKKMYAIISIVVLCLGFILVTGCTQNGTVPGDHDTCGNPRPYISTDHPDGNNYYACRKCNNNIDTRYNE